VLVTRAHYGARESIQSALGLLLVEDFGEALAAEIVVPAVWRSAGASDSGWRWNGSLRSGAGT